MKKKRDKDIVRVLMALRDGEDTSKYISNVTGISTAAVSAYLGELVKCGLAAVKNKECGTWNEQGTGRRFNRWVALGF